MHLVQLFLPLRDEDGEPFRRQCYARIRDELTQDFAASPLTSARLPRACGKRRTATSSGTMRAVRSDGGLV